MWKLKEETELMMEAMEVDLLYAGRSLGRQLPSGTGTEGKEACLGRQTDVEAKTKWMVVEC